MSNDKQLSVLSRLGRKVLNTFGLISDPRSQTSPAAVVTDAAKALTGSSPVVRLIGADDFPSTVAAMLYALAPDFKTDRGGFTPIDKSFEEVVSKTVLTVEYDEDRADPEGKEVFRIVSELLNPALAYSDGKPIYLVTMERALTGPSLGAAVKVLSSPIVRDRIAIDPMAMTVLLFIAELQYRTDAQTLYAHFILKE